MEEINWEYKLDVVNCSKSLEYVSKNELYTSSDDKSCYSHKKSKYFGAYKEKRVHFIAEIVAMFEIKDKNNITILWKNSEKSEKELKMYLKKKTDKIKNPHFGEGWTNVKIILLTNLKKNVNFQKDTKGGMWGVKKYFNLGQNVKNIDDLYNELNKKKKWSEFK